MTASVVINTYNRARSLERLLPSLEHLDFEGFEVVVVNGPSTDDTDVVLDRYAGRLKVARCESANLSRSRNIGIAAAAGDVVVFIDDDALPGDAGWLRKLVSVFDKDLNARIGAAGGASIHRDTEWTEFAGGWTSDYGEQLFTDQPLRLDARPQRWCRRTVGNNSAFRRSALVEVGGFDERFLYYLDEADVCLRLARAGYEVAYLQDCPVRHYPASSPLGAPFIRNRRLISRSDTYYCLKNGTHAWPRRLIEALWRAPRKHFVRELQGLVDQGHITRSELWRMRGQWLRGLVEGIGLGLFSRRANHLTAQAPPILVPFRGVKREGVLSICLLSRRLPPDPHAGGVGRYTYDLARGLHELGHRVTILAESDVERRREALDFDVVGVRGNVPPSGLKQTPILAQNLGYAEAVLARLNALEDESGPFDVIHGSNWGLEAIGVAQCGAMPLALMLVTPLERVIAAEGWDTSLDLTANIELDQWVVERATRVCAPSSGVLASYEGRSGWSGRDVHAVPLGIVCHARSTHETHERKRLLFVGRLERRKGIHVLLDVLPRLLDGHPEWQCDLVGNAAVPAGAGVTFESLFRERHAGAPWSDRVVFHGAVPDEDLHAFYRNADLFVAPSLYESFGLIYQEAMQYGVPVVGCRAGGVSDVVRHEEHGLLVPPGDAVALEHALARLMSDAALRRRMGACAEETVRVHGSHVAMARRMVAEYRAAMADHASVASGETETQTARAVHPLIDDAIGVLEAASPTKGLGLAFRASAALDNGAHAEAAALIAGALGVSANPEYLAMALEVALAEGDAVRAVQLADRGFSASRDDSDVCLTFVAALVNAGERATDVHRWEDWHRTHGAALPQQWFAAAVAAIRAARDFSAILLLEVCVASSRCDRALSAQALYHLGSALKRRAKTAEARRCFERLLEEDRLSLLPAPLKAAFHFHFGEIDFGEHRLLAAIEHFEACLSINAGHGRARTLLSEAIEAAAVAA